MQPEEVLLIPADVLGGLFGVDECATLYRVQPENVLLNSVGHVVVTDFGASKISSDKGDIRTDSWVGTEMCAPLPGAERA